MGASKLERGQELMRAVGMAGKMGKAGKTQSLLNKALQATQPADSPPGTGPKTNKRPTVGRPRSETTAAADDVGLPYR